MSGEGRSPVDAVAEFLHTGGPSLNADDAAVAIIGALTGAGFEVVPAERLRGAVEAERERIIERIRHMASVTLPEDVSRTALTIEKVAAVLAREALGEA